MSELTLNVLKWVAWVPGIDACDDWQAWTPELALQHLGSPPDLSFVASVVRRRLSQNSRLAIRVAHDCLTAETAISSAVFCSRHGECKRTLGIFEAMAKGEAVSPIQFSQSVHNTAAGIFSIERQLQIPVTSIAAGLDSGEQGFIEACSLVAADMGPVLWVMSDDRLSAPFDLFAQVPEFPFALALVLGQVPDHPQISLQRDGLPSAAGLPSGTNDLLALLTGQACFKVEKGNGWRWSYRAD